MPPLTLPKILNIPPKLLKMVVEFNRYQYFLLEGGRASGKTQSVARFILYIMEQRVIRVCCGREIQNSINESVKTVFCDLINEYKLDYEIKKDCLINRQNGSKIFFKGFREQGRVNIKGLEGIDILWIDEAQAIVKSTLDVIIPTIRKKNSVIFFTMNRYTRFDAVYNFCANREDCLHINICYFDNPYVDEKIIKEANIQKEKNINDYNHIWLGYPLSNNNEYLISSENLDKSYNLKIPTDADFCPSIVLSVDLSASGSDLCVAKVFSKISNSLWYEKETINWSEADTDITKGRIISLYSKFQPNLLIIDADGLGYPIWISLKKVIENTIGFRGAQKANNPIALNARADGYLILKEYLENGYLKLSDKNTIRQLEYLKKLYKSNGKIAIQDKKEIRKLHNESPDYADCTMMALWCINYKLNSSCAIKSEQYNQIEGDFEPFE